MSYNKILNLISSGFYKINNLTRSLSDLTLPLFNRYKSDVLSPYHEYKILNAPPFKNDFPKEMVIDINNSHKCSKWKINYVHNTTIALDRRIKETMAKKFIKKNGGNLSQTQIELFNSSTPSEEIANILGDESLFTESFKALEIEINN